MKPSRLRAIPSVDKVLLALGDTGLPRPIVLDVVRRELRILRTQKTIPDLDAVVARIRAVVLDLRASRIQPVINGTGSDSLIAFKPDTKEWVTIRVPYPLGFYTRGMDGRIDDPNAGWKGRGLWAANNDRVVWLHETGKGTTSQVAHVQLRPNPLAK